MNYKVVIPAAGQGKRMKAGKNKQFIKLRDVPVIIHTLRVFEQDAWCEEIILAVNQDEMGQFQELLSSYHINKVCSLIIGGEERQHSVYNGLKVLKNEGIVLIHDGARPFVTEEAIHRLVRVAFEEKAAVLGVPVKDTMKRVQGGAIIDTIERSSLWAIQTPQAFLVPFIKHAHEEARKQSFLGTDDASLVEQIGERVKVVESDYDNIKLTTPEDLWYAEAILQKREQTK
jgi:2-C-methyl-D-erythritol 4-phosphate cytidylyltransferase